MVPSGVQICSIATQTPYLPNSLLFEGMSLQWTGHAGHFTDKEGKLAAFDPSADEPGPGALLVRQDALTSFLSVNDYEIVWLVYGSKGTLESGTSKQWDGLLEIKGAYKLQDGKIVGNLGTSMRDD